MALKDTDGSAQQKNARGRHLAPQHSEYRSQPSFQARRSGMNCRHGRHDRPQVFGQEARADENEIGSSECLIDAPLASPRANP